jgi:hypothetical protein
MGDRFFAALLMVMSLVDSLTNSFDFGGAGISGDEIVLENDHGSNP